MAKKISTIIEEKIMIQHSLLVTGQFYVGLEPIYKYITFYMTAKYIESNYMNKCKNLKEISNEKIEEYNIKDIDKISFYEQIHHFYSVINQERKLESKNKKKNLRIVIDKYRKINLKIDTKELIYIIKMKQSLIVYIEYMLIKK